MTRRIRKACSSASHHPHFTVDFQGRPQLRAEDRAKAGGFHAELKERVTNTAEPRWMQRLAWEERFYSRALPAMGQED